MQRGDKQSKIQNWNTADVNMNRQRKQREIYRTETMHMSYYRDEEAKV